VTVSRIISARFLPGFAMFGFAAAIGIASAVNL